MPIPQTREGLASAGYLFEWEGKCSDPKCRAEILWFWTRRKKLIPLDKGTLIPHFATCVNATRFKKKTR